MRGRCFRFSHALSLKLVLGAKTHLGSNHIEYTSHIVCNVTYANFVGSTNVEDCS